MKRFITRRVSRLIPFLLALVLFGCNYNYHQGLQLEKEGRYEEANIEYHRAYTSSPGNEDFKAAYERTAKMTAEDLIARYYRYVEEKKYLMAYRRLEQARALAPDMEVIREERKKWYKVLLAGQVDLVEIQSLRNKLPLSDKIEFTVKINTPNGKDTLDAPVNFRNKTFSVEDVLYDPPQDILMLYSLNSIGVRLTTNTTDQMTGQRSSQTRFLKFIDFKTPTPISIQGRLTASSTELMPVTGSFPAELLKKSNNPEFWRPSRGSHYSLLLDQTSIKVENMDDHIEFLPQMLYVNSEDYRYFLDFGRYELSQRESVSGQQWSIRRVIDSRRAYLEDLRKNLLLNIYFFYRDGAYPFVLFE